MTFRAMMLACPRPATSRAVLGAMAIGLMCAACVSDGPGNPATRAIGVTTTTPEPAGFVRQSRPAGEAGYIPVGVTPPPRGEPRRSPEDLRKLEAELDADRRRSSSFARRPAPGSGYDGTIPPRPKPVPADLLPQ